ncbi:MAG: glycine cleavage system protein GcvH [Candidatus Eisenbacteria bacterium]|uniref:Glycine cleavage system H protein n=1 Tax=Eiseniibacteriota bacterium TaxID=2212470 RepID=A0A948RSS7_UNCEI|nr:glycine cleavage system protein GcvH [Candidatus Eisenbacteria bacterium]MBU1947675.1 glycine cleavage system protein GcvH [Candidatus Eisenbacteria bacterium]MBU2690335.1 glycine cleavage system protein GcvH [Candidatus Eisenbacteria bacterium]
MEFPEGFYYTKDHEWVRKEGDEVVIGITDYAQQALGDIVFVELPADGGDLRQGDPFGSVEAVKAVADLFSPIVGSVTAVNLDLEDNPGLVNASPYGDGWIIRAKVDEATHWDELLDVLAYQELVKGLEG